MLKQKNSPSTNEEALLPHKPTKLKRPESAAPLLQKLDEVIVKKSKKELLLEEIEKLEADCGCVSFEKLSPPKGTF